MANCCRNFLWGLIAIAAGLMGCAVRPATPESPPLPEWLAVQIDHVNPAGGPFPGGRGENELVVYTPESGRETTGTNIWGVEAIVKGRRVVSVGGNDSPIPHDGFVISGHGRGQDWIELNLAPGVEVRRDGRTLRYGANTMALLRRAEGIIAGVENFARREHRGFRSDAADQLADLAAARRAELDDLKSMAAAADLALDHDLQNRADSLLKESLRMYQVAIPRAVDERTGVWWRITDPRPEAIRAELRRMKDAGLNEVLIETIYEGLMICPPQPGLDYEQWPEHRGHDSLRTAIGEAHALGMRVHAWVHVFFAGFETSPLVAKARAEGWLAQRRDGSHMSSLETWDGRGYYFLSPAQECVRDFLIANLKALTASYDFDALHVDYIRYPVSIVSEGCEYDYSEMNRALFREKHGADPMNLYPADGEMWRQWCLFREDQINDFMGRLNRELRGIRPGLEFSAAVFGDVDDARGKKFQNWAYWVNHGWIDSLYFMLYFTDPEIFREKLHVAKSNMPREIPWTAGLPAFLGLPVGDVQALNSVARMEDAPGLTWFAWNTIAAEDVENFAR